MDQSLLREMQRRNTKARKMRISATILLATLIATPAMAIDIVSGSGAVVKNGAGLAVVNGDPCSGRMDAVCLDREEARRNRPESEPLQPVEQTQVCRSSYPDCE